MATHHVSMTCSPQGRAPRRRPSKKCAKSSRSAVTSAVAAIVLSTLPSRAAAADDRNGCIPLTDSTSCPAFKAASISTNQTLVDYYPFLQFVSDRKSFDNQLSSYVRTSYIKDRYQSRFGCNDVDMDKSSEMYARYTKTIICNALVQMSIKSCRLSDEASRPICADTCAEFAQSEAYVTADKDLCSDPRDDLSNLIRADFTTCGLPEKALTGVSGECISGVDNEPDNCGFGNSTVGLCSYCSAGGANSTDTCCYHSNAEERCEGVKLPSITTTISLSAPATPTSTPTSSSTSMSTESAASSSNGNETKGGGGLGGGAIAGIVIGSLAGVALLVGLLFFCVRRMKRRPNSQQGSIFNQPSPARKGPLMSQSNHGAPQGYEVLPGGRIARMSALEGHSGSPTNGHGSPTRGTSAFVGSGHKGDTQSSSDEFAESSEAEPRGALRPPPTTNRRHGSLSSASILGSDGPQSPTSAGGFSSPNGLASQQSEQLPFFKDYYSQDDIHPADKVSVLWAYQPRAVDEFSLERGDMLKVVGIWDDGWATGVMLNERADEWEAHRQAQRDSGVSNTSGHRDSSPAGNGEMKAFPLVCVCMPQHWRKTIEGDGSTETESIGHNGHSTAS